MQASDGTKGEGSESKSAKEGAESSRNGSASAKKLRMVWTIELHKRFLNAVNHLVRPGPNNANQSLDQAYAIARCNSALS